MVKLGDSYEEMISFTQEDIIKFAEVSGDDNPLHIDEEYAKTTIFGGTIVHGMLAASVFSKIFGTKYPGKGTIYLSQELSFLAPVLPYVKYVAKVEVLDLDKERHNAILSTILMDTEGHKCISGLAKIKNKEILT